MAEYGISALSPYARAIAPREQGGLGVGYAPTYPTLAPKPPSVWDSYRQALAPPSEQMTAVQSAVMGVRHSLESAAIGALLGLINGKFGTLDVAGKYPIDGIAAALLLIMSVKDAGKPDGFASDLRAMSQSCTSVAFFRKTSEWAAEKEGPKTEASGDMSRHTSRTTSKDPLLAAAEKYGLYNPKEAA